MGLVSMTSVDGVISRTEDARIPVLDRGFLFGDSIYEVFRTYRGVPLFESEHWERFQCSAALMRLDVNISLRTLQAAIRAVAAATGALATRTDFYVRYMLTRGHGAIDLAPPLDAAPTCVIVVKNVPHWRSELYSHGVSTAVPATRRNAGNALDPNIKSGNYLNNVLGLMEARALGAEDCIMLDAGGFVTEASNSNVFFVIDGEIVTPSQQTRNLRGLTKAAVHAACREQGLSTAEREIPAAELPRAAECFVTSSTRGVMPVVSLRLEDGAKLEFPTGGGEQTRRVMSYYEEYVEAYVDGHRGNSFFAEESE